MSLRKLWLKIIKKMTFLPQEYYVKCYYEYYSGKKINYNNLVEFNQKLTWYKVFYRPKILNILVDKFAVRSFVKDRIGKEFLNECIGVYTNPSKINFDELPNQFVIKGVHGCNFNLIVKDKTKLNKIKARILMYKWLSKNYYYKGGLQWAYKDIKPRIVIEKFLEDKEVKELIDYKFYCFNGEPKFLVAQSDKLGKYFYDLNWNFLPFTWRKNYNTPIDEPSNFAELKELAVKLSEGFPFVRVDFYSVDGQSIFGEMTFYPTNARDDFYPEKYNKIVGDYFVLPKIPDGEKFIKEHELNESY
ncbi:ATP-grasp fold amidoligase family protein [Tenacibaculum soleae]|uniref:ATP-grasp fold amidoligase family protein n=1 Tax=Tenacibaculum soleae TaxID=447689 RepID=UPI0026E4431B|nr:ATP-grasp fold amidoligase family protein [Tenacibaculum soleae]